MLHRDVITVSGADARAYLHGQLAQDVAGLEVGESRWALLLEPAGKVAAMVRVRAGDDECFELDVDAGFGADVEERINRFRIRVDVSTRLAERVSVDPAAVVGWWATSRAERAWADDVGGLTDDGGEGYEVRRVAAGWPAMGREIRPGETLPAESGVLDVAVRIGKGCYPGQELVERMDSRGATGPRRLVRIPAGALAVGDVVIDDDGAAAGAVTSVAGEWALAVVRRASTVGEVVGAQLRAS